MEERSSAGLGRLLATRRAPRPLRRGRPVPSPAGPRRTPRQASPKPRGPGPAPRAPLGVSDTRREVLAPPPVARPGPRQRKLIAPATASPFQPSWNALGVCRGPAVPGGRRLGAPEAAAAWRRRTRDAGVSFGVGHCSASDQWGQGGPGRRSPPPPRASRLVCRRGQRD